MGLCLSRSGGLLWTCKCPWALFAAISALRTAPLERLAAAALPNRRDTRTLFRFASCSKPVHENFAIPPSRLQWRPEQKFCDSFAFGHVGTVCCCFNVFLCANQVYTKLTCHWQEQLSGGINMQSHVSCSGKAGSANTQMSVVPAGQGCIDRGWDGCSGKPADEPIGECSRNSG